MHQMKHESSSLPVLCFGISNCYLLQRDLTAVPDVGLENGAAAAADSGKCEVVR